MKAIISKFLNEWQQNPRLRLGGWLILAIVLLYTFLCLSDWEQTLRNDYHELTGRLGRLELLARQKEWTERADAARAVAVQMEGRFWKANSRGMAHAKVQTWIDNILRKTNIRDVRIQTEPAGDMVGYDGVWQVAARIEGYFEPRKLTELLRIVETHKQIMNIEQLHAVANNRQPRFILLIKAYFQANSA